MILGIFLVFDIRFYGYFIVLKKLLMCSLWLWIYFFFNEWKNVLGDDYFFCVFSVGDCLCLFSGCIE